MTATSAAAVRHTSSVAAPVTVACIDDVLQFTALRGPWTELLHASDADCPFLTWEWLHAWWTHLRGASGLRLVTVSAHGELIAIAPLRIAHPAGPWFSSLEFLGSGDAGSDYLDVIVRRGCESDAQRAICSYVGSQNVALRLTHLRPEATAVRIGDELTRDGWASSVTDGGTCPYIPLAGHSWDSYLETLSGSHRASFRRQLNRLGRQHDLRFDRVTTEESRHEMLGFLVDFHDRRWGARGGSSAFLSPSARAFHEDATRRALDAGWLRMYVLRLDDTPAAVMYGFAYGGRFYFYQHGFDDRYKKHSVGLLLIGLTIRAAIEEGAREFDMLWGVEPYKFLWARDTRRLQQLELFPSHVGGRVHQRAVAARRVVATLTRRVRSTGDRRAT